MKIDVVDTDSDTVQPQDAEFTTIPTGEFVAERVGAMLNLTPQENSKYKSELKTLVEYAKLKTDDHTPEGIKWAIRQLGVKLGTPPLGERLISYLYVYAKLYLQGRQIEERKQRFLRGEKDDYGNN